MKVTPTALPGVLLLQPCLFEDERGSLETFNARIPGGHEDRLHSCRTIILNRGGVLRGLHYQVVRPRSN